ncbi:MAG: PHP domain-containing protein [Thermoproteota archaeon]
MVDHSETGFERGTLIRADLHLHTRYSPDASINPKTVVHQLYAHPTIKAAAITDHDTLRGYHKVKQLAKPYPDLVVIPGVEVTSVGGHILALGITRLPPKPWTAKKIIEFVRKNGGVSVAAHPYRPPGLGDAALDYNFDAVEVLNGISTPQANDRAKRLSRVMDLLGLAGSDAHHADQMWTVYTEVESSLEVNSILEAIREGRVKVAYSKGSIHF